jgi:hypothetical protein
MRFLAAIAIAFPASACVPDTGIDPEQCAEPTARIELSVTPDGMEPVDPAVCRDQEVTLAIDSEVDGILHIHGYDAEVPASPITAGATVEVTFVASRSGQFPIELHPADDPAGIELGVFTVHEP